MQAPALPPGSDKELPYTAHVYIGGEKVEDTGQDIVVERREVFQRIHNRNNEVVVPLDLRQHLMNNNKRDRGSFNITNHRKDIEFKLIRDVDI